MRNYKILVIILLAISITVITSISHAQISEQIPSPKKQIDNGVAPHVVELWILATDLIKKQQYMLILGVWNRRPF